MEKGEAIKAKGDELIEKFMLVLSAKECAIIAVEEIIANQKWFYAEHYSRTIDFDITKAYSQNINFWNEVLNYLKTKL